MMYEGSLLCLLLMSSATCPMNGVDTALEDDSCSICFEPLSAHKTIDAHLDAQKRSVIHTFHEVCLYNYYQKTYYQKSGCPGCPLCRASIDHLFTMRPRPQLSWIESVIRYLASCMCCTPSSSDEFHNPAH